MTPSPPAFETAAANSGPAATFMPTQPAKVSSGVLLGRDVQQRTCKQDGVLNAEELCDGCCDGGHGECNKY